jgi:redox-sensing transcriptional repressor
VTDQHAATPDEALAEEPATGGVRRARAAIGRAVRSTLPGRVEPRDEPRRDDRAVPEASVARLAVYLRVLSQLAEQGVVTVSSEELAAAAGVNSANLRKDLSHIGSYGTRGVGYEVAVLVERIEGTLGLTRRLAVALIGVGNLGHALAGYGGFTTRGFHIASCRRWCASSTSPSASSPPPTTPPRRSATCWSTAG